MVLVGLAREKGLFANDTHPAFIGYLTVVSIAYMITYRTMEVAHSTYK